MVGAGQPVAEEGEKFGEFCGAAAVEFDAGYAGAPIVGMPRTVTVVVVELVESLGLCAPVREETQGEVDAFDLPKPAFGLGVCSAGEQVWP